jgi:uncharacterized protein YeaO (DUF488 family)
MKINVGLADARARIDDVLGEIAVSPEWAVQARVSASDFMAFRERFRHFFDRYEDRDRTEWLGITEWAVVETLRSWHGKAWVQADIAAEALNKMASHPNIELVC